MRRALKAAMLLAHVLTALFLSGVLALDQRGRLPRRQLVRWWQRRLLEILEVRVRVSGHAHTGPRLTVANHVSWLDIPVIGALEDTRFVAKAEVRDWPVAGTLAQAAGAFYIRRSKGGSAPLLDKLVPYLSTGGAVTVFPEGTTSDGTAALDFHPRLFSAAIESGVPVQPVALVYGPEDDTRRLGPFIGEDDLLRHILRLLGSDGLTVGVRYFEPLPAAAGRDWLAQQAQRLVGEHLRRAGAGRAPVRGPQQAPRVGAVINL